MAGGAALNQERCGLGGLIPYPVVSAMKHFPEDFGAKSVEELNLPF